MIFALPKQGKGGDEWLSVTFVNVFSPAKLNLFLAITGRRADGFHDLVSVVAPVKFGDNLRVERVEGAKTDAEVNAGSGVGVSGCFSLECDDPAVPCDETNLILKAAKAFVEATGEKLSARFVLGKRIPMGAGLGGGSSNAVAALLALNQLVANPLSRERLLDLAIKLGSDCPLFLHGKPLVMRGRGERIEALEAQNGTRLSGRRALVFKPSFSIATAWAFGRMAVGAPMSYLAADEAEARLACWRAGDESAEKLLFNNMEQIAFAKYVALPVLLERLRGEFGLAVAMSGSGSACFALLRDGTAVQAVVERIREAWGRHTFIVDTEIV